MMSVKRPLRSFSLYDSQRKLQHRRGGRSGFRNFLATIGHAARPILKGVERGLMAYGKQKLAKKVGVDAVQYGSDLLKQLAEGKSIKDAAQSKEGRQLLQKGLKTGWNRIKGQLGGANIGVPSDINRALTVKNREALQEVLQPRRRRRRSRNKSPVKRVTKKKKKAGSTRKKGGKAKRKKGGLKPSRSKRAGSVKRIKGILKRAGSSKSKKAGSKKVRFKKGAKTKSGGKTKSTKRVAGRKKGGGTPKSIFD